MGKRLERWIATLAMERATIKTRAQAPILTLKKMGKAGRRRAKEAKTKAKVAMAEEEKAKANNA